LRVAKKLSIAALSQQLPLRLICCASSLVSGALATQHWHTGYHGHYDGGGRVVADSFRRDMGYAAGAPLASVVADLLGINWAIGIVGGLMLCSVIVTALIMRETTKKR
jgi:hypothetical protein